MQGVFITGTNTDVGKTYIGVLIAKLLKSNNYNVIPRKPIESGCEKYGDELIPRDATALKEAAQYDGLLSDVCPYRFEPPVSPERAAYLTDKVITTSQLAEVCLKDTNNGFVLVEGAGGFYSPLAEDGLNADLAVALNLPVLLITSDELGCLSQVLLCAEAIKMRNLNLMGVILNTSVEHDEGAMDNLADLKEHLDCPIYKVGFNEDNASLPQDLLDRLTSISQAC